MEITAVSSWKYKPRITGVGLVRITSTCPSSLLRTASVSKLLSAGILLTFKVIKPLRVMIDPMSSIWVFDISIYSIYGPKSEKSTSEISQPDISNLLIAFRLTCSISQECTLLSDKLSVCKLSNAERNDQSFKYTFSKLIVSSSTAPLSFVKSFTFVYDKSIFSNFNIFSRLSTDDMLL